MAASSKRLTARGVATINNPGRHADGDGLYLNVSKSGSKSWVFLFQRGGRRREIGLGSVSDVPLSAARAKVTEVRQTLAAGGDPFARRDTEQVVTFAMAVDALLADLEAGWRNPKHSAQWRMTLKKYAAMLGPRPVAEVGTEDVLAALRPLWQRVPETASRTRGRLERVLDYAKARGWRSGENPARWRGHLALILPRAEKLRRGHHRALPYADIRNFMGRLQEAKGHLGPRALEFLVLTAARSGEVLGATWGEINLDSALWTIPKERMKAKRPHRVPLSQPALSLLRHLR